jgi:hypothetical protein
MADCHRNTLFPRWKVISEHAALKKWMGCSVPIVKKECLLSSRRRMYLRQEYMDLSRHAVKPTWIGRRFMSFRGEGGSIDPGPWSVEAVSWSLDVSGSLACQTFRDVVGVFSDVY